MRPVARQLARWARRAVLLVGLALPGAGFAQTGVAQTGVEPRQVDETGALMPRQGAGALVQADAPAGPVNGRAVATADSQVVPDLDYTAWERMANRAETAIGSRGTTSVALEHLRAQLVDWREALLGAQNANAARIATLRTQIAALGPAPVDGQGEAEEIAKRRSALTEQLVTLQAPGIAAEEAYRRADGLIREIDRVQRERQADELLRLWPAPINPANWPEAVIGLTDTGVRLWDESAENWDNARARSNLSDNLPVIIGSLLLAIALIGYGRRRIERMALRLQDRASARGRKIWALMASLGEVLLPVVGVVLVVSALNLTGMLGVVGTQIVNQLSAITFPVIVASWIAGRVFPRGIMPGPLALSSEHRIEARYNAVAMGLLLGLDLLRYAAMDSQSYSEGTTSVLSFPGLVVAGLLLFRMGQLLRRHAAAVASAGENPSYADKLLGVLANGTMVLGVLGPCLGAVGYISAAAALVYPAILSLGLIGLLLILQDLVADFYALLVRDDKDPEDALIPVLANFTMALASLPLFALIWGARLADITELWNRFREGFTLGETRISPTDFMVFALVFGLGYTLTRMLQGGLKTTILPRTALDQGGQNAIVSGLGYVGIFLAALVGINAAGIDLSGLAIVAGALSVGIGFGLQTVVSNFVSGIILLIERPVSEGDWIEVGTTQGIVKSISVRSTRIQTFDKSDVIVPNSDLISGRVTNWTRFNMSGRLIVPVAVPFTSDSRKVEAILRDIAQAQPLAILTPPPVIALMGFGPEVMNFEIRLILRDIYFQLQVRSEINHQIAERFRAEGIVFSNAHRDHLKKLADEAAAEAMALAEEQQHLEAVAALLAPPPHGAAAVASEPDATELPQPELPQPELAQLELAQPRRGKAAKEPKA